MDSFKVTIGASPQNISPTDQKQAIRHNFEEMRPFRQYIYDLHFPLNGSETLTA